jgi:hypothetical protein
MGITDLFTHDLHSYLAIKERDKEIDKLQNQSLSKSWSNQELKNKLYKLEQELEIRKIIEEDLIQELEKPELKSEINNKIEEFLNKPETHCPQCKRELKNDKLFCMYCGWRK